MQGRQERRQEDLFVACPLRALVPEDHILKRVDAVLDLSWIHDEVRDCYCQNNGRTSIGSGGSGVLGTVFGFWVGSGDSIEWR